MATPVYLSNDPSSISGYLVAYIGERSPLATTTVSNTYTTTVVGVTTSTVVQTLTSTGAAAKWITAPLKAATTIAAKPFANVWAYESNTAANADVAIAFQQYTTSAQTAFLTTSTGVELGVSPTARVPWSAQAGESITSTAFAAGDRLIIAPAIGAAGGTMAAGFFVWMSYGGLGSNVDGDTYVLFSEDFEPNQAQMGNGAVPAQKGVGVSYFLTAQQAMQQLVDAQVISSNATVQIAIDECANQATLV